MRFFDILYFVFGQFLFLKVACSQFSQKALPCHESSQKKIFEPRQVSGVIARKDFLRRGSQSSIVVGDWVYIDGGEFSFTSDDRTIYQYSNSLLAINLASNWTNSTVTMHSNTKPNGAPSLNNPSLWYHETENLIYTGFSGWPSTLGNHPPNPPLSLWTFKPDGTGAGTWNESIGSTWPAWRSLTRPRTPLETYSRDRAFILGGCREELNLGDWAGDALNGMVQFDMADRSFANTSIPCCNAIGGIKKGAIQYVPSFGPEGVLLAMGGQNANKTGNFASLIDFTVVSVFDPVSQKWWNQTTTGNAPSPRIDFCIAGIPSTNDTYEIFVYAGWDTVLGAEAIQFDTINILTLPAFHWISIPYDPQFPRHAHSCNAVGGSQILVIGGLNTNPKITSGPGTYQSIFNSTPDPFTQGLAVFDMATLTFKNQYTAKSLPYEQSALVKQYYSTLQQSYTRDLTPGVAALMRTTHFREINQSITPASSTGLAASQTSPGNTATFALPTSNSTSSLAKSKSPNTGAIAGGVAGGCAVSLVVAAGFTCYFRRRQKPEDLKSEIGPGVMIERHLSMHELHTDDRHFESDGRGLYEIQAEPIVELEGHATGQHRELL